ncbi:bacteriocin [Kordia sp.]
MLEKFEQLTKEQMNSINGGAQTVEDINRTQPN